MILILTASIFINTGIVLLSAACQIAQSHLVWSSLPNNVALKILTDWHCEGLRPELLAK